MLRLASLSSTYFCWVEGWVAVMRCDDANLEDGLPACLPACLLCWVLLQATTAPPALWDQFSGLPCPGPCPARVIPPLTPRQPRTFFGSAPAHDSRHLHSPIKVCRPAPSCQRIPRELGSVGRAQVSYVCMTRLNKSGYPEVVSSSLTVPISFCRVCDGNLDWFVIFGWGLVRRDDLLKSQMKWCQQAGAHF